MKPSDFKTEQELQKYMNDNNLTIVNSGGVEYFMDADDYYLGGDNE